MADRTPSAAKRPLWKRVVFWGSAVLAGVLLAVTHAPFWAGIVTTGVLGLVLVPWFMLSGGRRG